MKKLAIAFVLILAVSVASAQSADKPLKGPKAKNYKPWKDTNRTYVTIQTLDQRTKLQGPVAKNQKIWKREESASSVSVTYGSERSKLKGPKAKNFKYYK